MPIETATYIHDFVPSNPVHTDGLAQADSHLRLIKQVLQNTFPNLTAAVSASSADLGNGFIPVGGVILWSGLVSAIPVNWHLCDGTTVGSVVCPDLRQKFVIGVDSHTGTYPEGSTGGAASQTVSSASDGAHSHGSATGAYALTIGDLPPHSHGISDPGHAHSLEGTRSGSVGVTPNAGDLAKAGSSSGLGETTGTAFTGLTVLNTGGGAGHSHSISSTGSTHTHSVTTPTLPPYYALAYIIRVT
jgi:hypothetical protein